MHGQGPPYGSNQGKVTCILVDSTDHGPTLYTTVNPSNTWIHFLLIRKGDSIKLFKDKILQDGIFSPGFKFGKTKGLVFGRGIGSSGIGDDLQLNLDGKIDEIGIWSRALSNVEITNLYNGGLCFQTVSVTDTLYINTGVTNFNPISYLNSIRIYPNPTKDHITIDNGNISNLLGHKMKITNSLGQIVFESTINQQQFYLDLSSWTGNGIYFVHLIDSLGHTIEIKKIVLQ